MLHAMERKGYLSSRIEQEGKLKRRICRATPYGVEALRFAREKVRELVSEVVPDVGKS